jgi:hypothetical protein
MMKRLPAALIYIIAVPDMHGQKGDTENFGASGAARF